MKIIKEQRLKLEAYLKKFYTFFPYEKHTIFHFVKYFKKRHRGYIDRFGKRVGTRQSWMGVTGEAGCGKSLFVLASQILYGRPFDLTKNVVYMPKAQEISNKLKKMDFSTLLIDEAVVSLRAVNWQDKDQQEVTKLAQTERFKGNWIFWNIPNFNEMTKSLRIGSSTFRIVIPYRTDKYARIIVQRKSRNFRDPDPWGDDFANKLYKKVEKKKKMITNEDLLNIERKMPSTIMDFIIPNLEVILPEVTTEYQRLKEESRLEKKEEIKDKNRWRDEVLPKAIRAIFYDSLGLKLGAKITKQRIADELGISVSTLNILMKK